MDIKNIIKEKTKNIEANIIGCFWNNPQLFLDYNNLSVDKFKNGIWKLYYSIGRKMATKNIKVIDEVAVELFLESKENILKAYNEYGGFNIIKDLEFYCTIENVDVYVNELIKWDVIFNIVDKFSFTEESLDKLNDLSSDEVYKYFSAILNNIFVNMNDDVIISKLNEDIDEIIDSADKGLDIGMPFNSPILSNEVGGWVDGQTYMVAGLSGAGKTTFVQDVILSSVWELNEPCVIMLNEQDNKKWKQQFLTWIINNIVLKNSAVYFNSKRWREGKFTEEEFRWINKARDLLNEKEISGMIIFAELKTYSQKIAERIIKKYSDLGIKKYILDTFKLSSDRQEEAFWLSMQEDMRRFDDLVKPSNLNVGLLCTLQLQKGSRLLRYLTSDNIGMAKNTIDVVSVALLMRRVWNDEYPNCSHELKVKKRIEGTDCYEEVLLDPTKKYVVIFIEKNRNGESQTYQVVAEQNLGALIYKEVGIVDIPVC